MGEDVIGGRRPSWQAMVSVENFHRSAAGPSAARGHAGRIIRRYDIAGHDLNSRLCRVPGSHVEAITPDADSRAAMDTNQMDPATRIPAARAGFAQGKQEATRVTFL
jgi:hypothetical protein